MALLPPKGESEITRTSTETMVLIPWNIAARGGRIIAAVVLVVYLGIWVIWRKAFGLTLRIWWSHMLVWWPVYVIFPVLGYVAPFVVLLAYDYLPKLLNMGWPLTTAQIDPLESGRFNYWNWPQRVPADTPENTTVTFDGSISNGSGKSLHWRLRTKAPAQWRRFANQLTLNTPFLRCHFSVRAARRFGVPEDEFAYLQHNWCAIGFAEKTSTANNAHAKLTPWGFQYMWELARTPLPQ